LNAECLNADRRHHRSAGFTLLEAIVAIAVIGLALIPIVSFLSLSANALAKAADANARTFATRAAIAVLDSVNPVEEPKGKVPLDDETSITWESEILAPAPESPLPTTSLPAYRISFHKLHVTVSRASTPWFDFDMRKVGYISATTHDFAPSLQDQGDAAP